jgi:opacity protein-like surface antigen
MKPRVVVCLFCSLLWLAGVTNAQSYPRFDLAANYAFLHADPSHNDGVSALSLNGGSLSLGYNTKSWIAATVDVGGYAGNGVVLTCVLTGCPTPTESSGTMWTYLAGPRVNFRHSGRFTPFAQALFGVAHGSGLFVPGVQNAFATSIGGGLDVRISNRFSLRPIQVDYLLTRFNEFDDGHAAQMNVRVSSGLAFHF